MDTWARFKGSDKFSQYANALLRDLTNPSNALTTLIVQRYTPPNKINIRVQTRLVYQMQTYRSDEREHHSGRDKVEIVPIQPTSRAHKAEHIQTNDKNGNKAALCTIHLQQT